MRWFIGALLVLSGVAAGIAPAAAERRVALVIGNTAYRAVPSLINSANDARDIAAALERLEFEVEQGIDLDYRAMGDAVRAFARKLRDADVALFFYAGHGLQVAGKNYLLPVDARLEQEADLQFEAVPLDVVMAQMEQAQRTNLVFLDACRDNPLARSLARSLGTRSTAVGAGLAEVRTGIGTLIAYATQPSNVALDGRGRNSPFTAALKAHIAEPGLEVRQMLTRVRRDVMAATGTQQVPWTHEALTGDFYFNPRPVAEAPRAPQTDAEVVFWQSIQGSSNPADFEDYLGRFSTGTFAGLARRRLDDLRRQAPGPFAALPAPSAPSQREQATRQNQPAQVAALPAAQDLAERRAYEGELSSEDRRAIQRSLGLLGLYRATLDGEFNGETRRAIEAFEAQTGIPADGYLSRGEVALLHQLAEKRPVCAIERREQAGGPSGSVRVSAYKLGWDEATACNAATAAAVVSGRDACEGNGGSLDLASLPSCDCGAQRGLDSFLCKVSGQAACRIAGQGGLQTVSVEAVVCSR